MNGFGDHQVHQANNGRAAFVDHFVVGDVFVHRFGEVDCGIGEFLQNRVSRFAFYLAVQTVNGFQDMSPRGQRYF